VLEEDAARLSPFVRKHLGVYLDTLQNRYGPGLAVSRADNGHEHHYGRLPVRLAVGGSLALDDLHRISLDELLSPPLPVDPLARLPVRPRRDADRRGDRAERRHDARPVRAASRSDGHETEA